MVKVPDQLQEWIDGYGEKDFQKAKFKMRLKNAMRCSSPGNVTAGLAESNGSLPPCL